MNNIFSTNHMTWPQALFQTQVWLQVGFGDEGETTWCDHSTGWEPEIGPYVLRRADLAAQETGQQDAEGTYDGWKAKSPAHAIVRMLQFHGDKPADRIVEIERIIRSAEKNYAGARNSDGSIVDQHQFDDLVTRCEEAEREISAPSSPREGVEELIDAIQSKATSENWRDWGNADNGIRYAVEYLHAQGHLANQTSAPDAGKCPHKRVDHNLECLDCDEPIYTPEE